MSVNGHCNFKRFQSDKQISGKIFKAGRAYNRNKKHVECKNKITPAVIRVTKNISKLFRKYLSSLPGNHDIKDQRKQPY
jgi:hypothetical protein